MSHNSIYPNWSHTELVINGILRDFFAGLILSFHLMNDQNIHCFKYMQNVIPMFSYRSIQYHIRAKRRPSEFPGRKF